MEAIQERLQQHIFVHARELVPPVPLTTARGERILTTSVKDFLFLYPAFEARIKESADARANYPATAGALVVGAAGYATASASVKVGWVAGAPFGPPGMIVGLIIGATAGAAAGYFIYKREYREQKEMLKLEIVEDQFYKTWKNDVDNEGGNNRRHQILDRLDCYMLQLGIVPLQFRCSQSGRVIRSAIAVGNVPTFDASFLGMLRAAAQNRFLLGGEDRLPCNFSKNLFTWLLEKDAWRLRSRFLAHLLVRDGGSLTLPQREELSQLSSYLQAQETGALTEAWAILTKECEAVLTRRQYDAAEVMQTQLSLATAEFNRDFYITVGQEIKQYLPQPPL
jgi:hypothetical protein